MNGAEIHNEKELLLLVCSGDRKAFSTLYTQYLDNLYKYVYLFTKSEETTEEIIQEVFIKIWERREHLNTVQSFGSYLIRAAKNKVIDHVRHSRVREKAVASYLAEKKPVPETPGDTFDYKAYYHLVQKAIEQLPPRRQLIFRMNTEKGLSYDEIATELNISKSAVKNQLYDAFDAVRQYLSKNGELSFSLILMLSANL